MIKFAAILLLLICSLSANKQAYASDVQVVKTYYATTSWYKHGKKTANGDLFRPYTHCTIAHKKLPFGTKLRLTNPHNNKIIISHVNDRGPYVKGVEFDISLNCAVKLDIIKDGRKTIKVEVLKG